MKVLLIWTVWAIIVFYGCKPNYVKLRTHDSKKAMIILDNYKTDTLVLKDYVFFHDSVYHNDKFSSFNGQDSVLSLFINALSKLKVPLSLDKPLINIQHPKISNFTYKYVISKRIPDSVIINLASRNVQNQPIVLPILYTLERRSWSIGGNSMHTYSSWMGIDQVTCIIYIINGGKIIYKREALLSGIHKEDEKISAHDAYTSRLKPEHWDTLVYKVMEDYIKRIKK